MPVAQQPVQVSLSDVLQVKAGALEEHQLWSVLCQSAKAVQDIFIKEEAVSEGLPSFVISPYTLLLCPSGRVKFAESVDTSRPDIRNYLPPEVLARQPNSSPAAIEKLYVYSLGMTIFWAADYQQTRHSLSHSLNAILMAMCDHNATSRVPLMTVLEACNLQAQFGTAVLSYSHEVVGLSKTVLGSVYELDALFGSGLDSSTFDTNRNHSLPSGQYSNGPTEHSYNSGRISPGKRQLRNGHDSYSQKRPRSNRSRHNRDAEYGDSGRRSRSHSGNRNSTHSTQPAFRRHLSSTDLESQDSYNQPNGTDAPDARSYHMSDIFSPSRVSHKTTVHPSVDNASQRSRSPHTSGHRSLSPHTSGRPPSGPSSRRRSRSPPTGGSRRSRASQVYERLRERRERLSLLREQMGLRGGNSQENPLRSRSVPNLMSDSETFSDDGSDYVGGRRSGDRYRSARSLNSASSAQEGSYYPDQFPSRYASAGTLPQDDDDEEEVYHGNERLDLQSNAPVVFPSDILAARQPDVANQPNGRRNQNGSMPNNRKPKKLKKLLGPEFVVMSSEPNDTLDIQPSFMLKSGKIPPDRKQITVVLLNGRRLDLMCDLGTLGLEMYDMVVSHIGVLEKYYFGLAYIKDGEYLFLDPEEKLYKVGPESWKEEVKKGSKKSTARDKFTLFFRVKFYVENTTLLRDHTSRHQYYLQLRKDILEERTTCNEQAALQLASLALQAEMGDYHPDSMGQNYFLPEHYVPTAVIDTIGIPGVRQRIPTMHDMHQGMEESHAELEFLMEARKLAEYGIHFHRVTRAKKDARTSIWYGICTRGLILYEKRGNTRVQVHAHPWHLTRKIAFNRKKFSIEPNDGSHTKILHYTDNYKKGRYLLKMCQAQHSFQMTMRSKAIASQQFYGDFPSTSQQSQYSNLPQPYMRNYDPHDDVDAGDYSGTEEDYPYTSKSSVYQDDRISSYSKRSTNVGSFKFPGDDQESRPAVSRPKMPEPLYSEPPEFDPEPAEDRAHHRPSRQSSRAREAPPQQQVRLRSTERVPDYEIAPEPGYATIGDFRPQLERSDAPVQRSEPQPQANGYHGNQDDRHVLEAQNGHGMIDPYVIDASIRTHERTQDPFITNGNDDIISETLRERLEDVPTAEQPEREINIVTLRKDQNMGLGFTIVGGENSSSMDLGIFVQSIAPNGPAEQDGRIQSGDRIISINGQSLEGVSHKVAVDILRGAEGAVQLIVSQPKSSSPVPRIEQTVHEVVDDVLYAKVNKPLHSRPNLALSDQSIDGKPPVSSSVERQKSTPPRKPQRRPESFGGSNYSLTEAGVRTPTGVASTSNLLTAEPLHNQPGRHGNNNQENGYPNDNSNLHSYRQRDQEPNLQNTQTNVANQESVAYDKDDERDFDSQSESEVPTPESSDVDDLFPEEDSRKPRINLRQATLRSQEEFPEEERPLSPAYESQQETGRESVMSRKSATDTDRGSAVPMEMRDAEQYQPGDRFHVHLSKRSGSLGISVTVSSLNQDGGPYQSGSAVPMEMRDDEQYQPGDRFHLYLSKRSGSLGISVTGGVNTSVKHGGIYIKSMVPSGAAALDGRIQIGDRVLEVNGEPLNGVTHKQAVETLRRAPEYSTLIIERGLPPTQSTLPPTPAPSPLVGIGENGEPVILSSSRDVERSEPPTTTSTSSDVVTSPERTTTSTTRNADQSQPTSTGPSSELPATSPTSPEMSTSSTPVPTSNGASNVASPTMEASSNGASAFASPTMEDASTNPSPTSNMTSPVSTAATSPMTVSTGPSPVAHSVAPSSMTASYDPSPSTVSNIPSPMTTSNISPDTVKSPSRTSMSSPLSTVKSPSRTSMTSPTGTVRSSRTSRSSRASMSSPSEDAITERHVIQDSPFSELSLPLTMNHPSSSAVSAEQSPIKERRISVASMASQQSVLPSDINFSDSDDDIMLPSDGSVHSRQLTPTIEALNYEDEDESGASAPQSDEETVEGSEVESDLPSDEDDEEEEDDDEDEDSEVNDMFDPGFASPALSTREADTLTPTAHLFGTGTPTRGVFGMRTTPSRSLMDGRPSPLPESAAESWLDSPPHSPPPPPPDSPPPSPPQSPPPAPAKPPPQQSTPMVAAVSPSIVPSDSPTVQSMPSPVSRSTSAQSTSEDRIISPGLSTRTHSTEPEFDSGDDESLPGFGSTLDSMGALTLSQTAFSTMGFASDIELPDLPYVNPENTFEVQLSKGPQGLGFSIQGGRGLHKDPRLCLIRIKKIFPGSPAARSEMMDEGDIVLAVNDHPVHHLNHDETVGVLRGAPKEVRLLLCRPSEEELEQLLLQQEEKAKERKLYTRENSTTTSPSLAPRTLHLQAPSTPYTPPFTPEVVSPLKQAMSPPDDELSWPLSSPDVSTTEEVPLTKRSLVASPALSEVSMKSIATVNEQDAEYLDITLVKPTRGGFGFTVAGGANSGGCYIKDIIHDPALSDGRLKKGDKLLMVNDADLRGMSHFDAVSFLRMAPHEVTLRVCRNRTRPDNVASPSPPQSPSKYDSAPSTRSNTPSVSSQDLPIIKIKRNNSGHLGLSLTLDIKSRRQGIFVGNITPGLPAEIEGSIEYGDEIHSINGRSLSAVGLLEARRVLDQAIPLVKLQVTRNGEPVHPVERSTQTPSPATTLSSPRTNNDPSKTPSPREQLPKSPPLSQEADYAIKSRKSPKPSLMAGLDFDLADVSEDESWEDFSSDDGDNDGGNSMDDVEAILASLDAGNKPKEQMKLPTESNTMEPKDETSSTPSPTKPVETSSAYPPTTSSSSVPQTPTKTTSGDDDYEGTSHYSTPTTQSGTSSEEDLPKASPATRGALTPISENESFAFMPYKPTRDSPLMSSPPMSPGADDVKQESPVTSPAFSDSPIDELLQEPVVEKPLSAVPDRLTPRSKRFTPVDSRSTPTNRSTPSRLTPHDDFTEPTTPTTSEGGVMWIDLEKPDNGSLGFSLTGGMKGGKTTILVKTITPEGVADVDGRLKIGDKILQVNGQSFVGMTQNKAVGVLRKCKGNVTLAIARNMSRPASQADTLHKSESSDLHRQRKQQQSSADSHRDTHDEAKAASPPSSHLSTVSEEHTASLALEMEFDEAEEDEDKLAELGAADDDAAASVHFESSILLPMSPRSDFVTPPLEFSGQCLETSGQDTDSDLDDTMDLPKDSPLTLPDENGAPVKLSTNLGQKPDESDESSSWGSDTDIPLSIDKGGPSNPTPRGTPSNKILSIISDAELRRMVILRPASGNNFSGRSLRNTIATIQKQIDKQDPGEEYKVIRQDLTNGTFDEANKPTNKDKNRYRNVLPYDKTRVVIEKGVTSDYINASHIQVQVGKDTQHFIACQGPLPNTTTDFWQMVWEQRADVIAMVTLDVEVGKVKCHRYWPDNMESPMIIGDRFQLRLDHLQTLEHFDIRKISMTDTQTNSIHYVTHLNFTTWPDHGVPLSALPLLRYTRYMRRIHTNGPIVVHCSAGIGRTGTLITIDTIIGLIDRDEQFKIVDIVKDLRSQRQGMIQTKDQYAFCYKAALEALKTLL